MRSDFKRTHAPLFALFVCACSPLANPDDRGSAPPGDAASTVAPGRGDTRDDPPGASLPPPSPPPAPPPARPSCEAAGQTIPDGGSVPAGDGCNTCSCYDGFVSCSAAVCDPVVCSPLVEASDGLCTRSSLDPCQAQDPDCVDAGAPSCEAAGQTFPDGSELPSGDSCNTCRCSGGSIVCSELVCDLVFCAAFVEESDGVCSRFPLDACRAQDPDCSNPPEPTEP